MTDEYTRVKECFFDEGIEYFSALDYRDCVETGAHIMRRAGLEPRSVLVFLIPYYGGETVNLSRYAAAKDYHLLIKKLSGRLIERLERIYPDAGFCAFGDHSPIDERGAALAAGLGILGDNGLIINEKYGSYVFIADIVTDIAPEEIGAVPPKRTVKCEGCGACRAACPGGILSDSNGVCLSAITQKKGELSDGEKELIRRTGYAWGCDLCQTVCPHNAAPRLSPIPFFHEDRIERLDSPTLDGMSDEEFTKRAFAWRGRNTVNRNLKLLGI